MSEEKTAAETKAYIRRRRIVGLVSLAVVLILFTLIGYVVTHDILGKVHTPEEFHEYIASFGWKGRLVFLGLQVLQVVVAIIPGELVQVGGGYAFGAFEGTVLCLIGAAIASAFIFLLTKKLGVKLVEAFISREKISELKFINDETKLKRTIFILFFIPGAPKDLFTYFAGLTRITLPEFLVISTLARTPCLVSSTIGGHMFGDQNYLPAVILFAVTGLISLGGMALYSWIVKNRKPKPAPESGGENDDKKNGTDH